jgi:hypothetical protein
MGERDGRLEGVVVLIIPKGASMHKQARSNPPPISSQSRTGQSRTVAEAGDFLRYKISNSTRHVPVFSFSLQISQFWH